MYKKFFLRKFGNHFHFENAKFVNIRQTYHYYFMNGLHNVMGQRCNFYYNILLMKKFRRPCYQTIVARDLNIQDKNAGLIYILTNLRILLILKSQNSITSYSIIFYAITTWLVNGIQPLKKNALYVMQLKTQNT